MLENIMIFAGGIMFITLVDALAGWVEAKADQIMVENEERRAKLKQ